MADQKQDTPTYSDAEMNIRQTIETNMHNMIKAMGIQWQSLCGRPKERLSELAVIFPSANELPKETYFSRYWNMTKSKHGPQDRTTERIVNFINATFEEPRNLKPEQFVSEILTFKLPENLKTQVDSFNGAVNITDDKYKTRFTHKYTLMYYSGSTPTIGYLKIKNNGTQHYCTIVTGFTTALDEQVVKKIDKWIDTILDKGPDAVLNKKALAQWIRNENSSIYYGPVEIYPQALSIYAAEVTKPHERFYASFDTSVFHQQQLSDNHPWLGGAGSCIRNFSNRTTAFPIALACCDAVYLGSLSDDVSPVHNDGFAREWLGHWSPGICKHQIYADAWKKKVLTTPGEILAAGDLYTEKGGYSLTVSDRADLAFLMLKEYLKEQNGRVISHTEAADKCLYLYVNSKLTIRQRIKS